MDISQDQEDAIDHLENCIIPECSLCNHLLEFYMACECGIWGHQDSSGWILVDGVPICQMCADKINEDQLCADL